ETFFESFHAKLPLATRMLLAVANFTGTWGWLIFVVLATVIIGSTLYFRTIKGRGTRDRILLGMPVVGDLLRHAIVERFCRIFGSMLVAGVSVPEALAVTGDATNNTVYQEKLATAREAMLRGEGLAGPLSASELFPTSVNQMFRVGEDT